MARIDKFLQALVKGEKCDLAPATRKEKELAALCEQQAVKQFGKEMVRDYLHLNDLELVDVKLQYELTGNNGLIANMTEQVIVEINGTAYTEMVRQQDADVQGTYNEYVGDRTYERVPFYIFNDNEYYNCSIYIKPELLPATISVYKETEKVKRLDSEYMPLLISPNGTKYKITVADDGTLSAVAATE